MTRPAFAPPAGRQGPGPLPAGLVDALDLAMARRASGVLPGERRAPGVGAGTELFQLRPYEPGDDVRQLDAAASARTGIPHVRVHVPERTLTTWLVLDVSASMAFGTADRLKADVAEGVARVVGRVATRRGGRLAVLTAGGPQRLLAPHTGPHAQVALHRVLAEGDTSSSPMRARFAEAAAAERAEVATELRHAHARHVVLSTRGDWLRDLGRALR